jgi:hypothetical protein
MIEPEYLARELGRSVYVFIPFNDYNTYDITEEYSRRENFHSGVKVFKITVLD